MNRKSSQKLPRHWDRFCRARRGWYSRRLVHACTSRRFWLAFVCCSHVRLDESPCWRSAEALLCDEAHGMARLQKINTWTGLLDIIDDFADGRRVVLEVEHTMWARGGCAQKMGHRCIGGVRLSRLLTEPPVTATRKCYLQVSILISIDLISLLSIPVQKDGTVLRVALRLLLLEAGACLIRTPVLFSSPEDSRLVRPLPPADGLRSESARLVCRPPPISFRRRFVIF